MAATRTSGMRYGIIDNSSRGLLAVWSHGQGEAGDGLHFGFFAFSERLLADRVPDLPLHEHLPTRGQIGLGDGDAADHALWPRHRPALLGLHRDPHHDHELGT